MKKNIFLIRKISFILLAIAIIIGFAAPIYKLGFLVYIMIALLGLSLLLNITYWRCPFCQVKFPHSYSEIDHVDYCPFCSKKLRN